jgi:subtilisin family serine protease
LIIDDDHIIVQASTDVSVHTLRVHLSNKQGSVALSREWKQDMIIDNIEYGSIAVVSASYLDISVHDATIVRMVSWLLFRNDVTWVEIRDTFTTQNKHARYLIQDNVINRTLIWSHGIAGQGQIVALGDTGIDYDHCFFHDVNHTIPMGSGIINHKHRKIVTYVPIGDQGDASAEAGHGTHVVSSFAPSALSFPFPFLC